MLNDPIIADAAEQLLGLLDQYQASLDAMLSGKFSEDARDAVQSCMDRMGSLQSVFSATAPRATTEFSILHADVISAATALGKSVAATAAPPALKHALPPATLGQHRAAIDRFRDACQRHLGVADRRRRMPMQQVRIGIADDHGIVRSSLKDYLQTQPGLRVVGEAADGREAIDLVRKVPMDILILDVDMRGHSGLDAIAMLRAKAPSVRLLVLSSYPLEIYAVKLIGLGASAYLNKQCEPAEILQAIDALASGKRYMQPDLAALLAEQFDRKTKLPHERLSDKEFQVFLKLARGERSAQVGHEVSIGKKTVSSYRILILRKMGLGSNSDLTAYALKHKLID